MSFKITIEEAHDEVQTRGHDWMLLGKQSDAVYGYTPEIEKHVTVTTKIYEQIVDELDLPLLAALINGFPVILDPHLFAQGKTYFKGAPLENHE